MRLKGKFCKREKKGQDGVFCRDTRADEGSSKHNFFTDSEAFWMETAMKILFKGNEHIEASRMRDFHGKCIS